MLKGKYIGPIRHLRGFTALLQLDGALHYKAQFDDVHCGLEGFIDPRDPKRWDKSLGYGWHRFDRSDFEVTCNFCGRTASQGHDGNCPRNEP